MAEQEEEGKPKKGGSKMILVVVIALLAAGGGVGAGIFLFGGGGKEAKAAPAAGHGAPAKAGGGGEHGEEGDEEGHGGPTVVAFDPFVVNLADPKGDRFLKVGLRAVVNDATLAGAFRTDELLKARVRDRIISVLTSKSYHDINTTAGKEGLRQELRSEMNSVLPEESIEEVLFVEFAVQ